MGYYMGDPGFFSIIKSAAGTLAGGIPGIGGIASKIISKIPIGVRTMGAKGASAAAGAIVKHPVISAAGAAGALALSAGGGAVTMGCARPGYHPTQRHLPALAMGLRLARPRLQGNHLH